MRDLFNLYKRRLINKPIDALDMCNLNGLNIMEKHSLIFSYWYNYERGIIMRGEYNEGSKTV